MNKIILFSQTLDPEVVTSVTGGFSVVPLATLDQLIKTVVEEPSIGCLIIQQEKLNEELRRFLVAVKENIPVLFVGLILPRLKEGIPDGCRCIDGTLDTAELRDEIQNFIASIDWNNKRQKHRFDWPLKGFLSFDKQERTEYRVRSLSAAGAFLECKEGIPSAGSQAELQVLFLNCRFTTNCEIMDPRQASSNLSAGFGVRFVDLDQASSDVLDRIVKDALVKKLTGRDPNPGVPSLEEEEAFTSNFELL